MGFLDTIKGWFNIGGVKVEMQGFEPVVSRSGDRIAGRVVLTSEGDKQVKQMVYRFIRRTMKKGQEANARFDQIGESIVDRSFAIRKGETKAFDFAIPTPSKARRKTLPGGSGRPSSTRSSRARTRTPGSPTPSRPSPSSTGPSSAPATRWK